MKQRFYVLLFRRRTVTWVSHVSWFLGISLLVYGLQYAVSNDSWHNTSAQHIIQSLPIPYSFYGSIYIVAGLLTLITYVRPLGLFLGFVINAFFAGILWEQCIFGTGGWIANGFFHGPPPSLALGSTLIATFFIFFCRRVIYGDPVAEAHAASEHDRMAGA